MLIFLKSIENLTDLNNIPKPAEWPWEAIYAGDKLPNSGDALGLQVPSYTWKSISGWSNYSCTVITLESSRRNVGYRGSKSISCQCSSASHNRHVIVKEQRVDGSCIGNPVQRVNGRCMGFPMLRYTLMGFARSYPVKNPFKQISLFSTQVSTNLPKDSPLNPWFVTGFIDAEGSFIVSIVRDSNTRTGWNIQLRFKIALHKKDLPVMEQIKTKIPFFLCLRRERNKFLKNSFKNFSYFY